MIPKCRVWDELGERMVYNVGFTPDGIAYTIPKHAEESDQFDYYPECPVMLSTGLKDKNGKEIYLGDIVAINKETTEGFYRNDYYEVAVNDFMKIPVIDSEIGQEVLYKVNMLCKVVGNIYENSELLQS